MDWKNHDPQTLLGELQSGDDDRSERAVHRVAELGERMLPLLLEQLQSQEPISAGGRRPRSRTSIARRRGKRCSNLLPIRILLYVSVLPLVCAAIHMLTLFPPCSIYSGTKTGCLPDWPQTPSPRLVSAQSPRSRKPCALRTPRSASKPHAPSPP